MPHPKRPADDFVGLRVRSFFPGHGWFNGVVTRVVGRPHGPFRVL